MKESNEQQIAVVIQALLKCSFEERIEFVIDCCEDAEEKFSTGDRKASELLAMMYLNS